MIKQMIAIGNGNTRHASGLQMASGVGGGGGRRGGGGGGRRAPTRGQFARTPAGRQAFQRAQRIFNRRNR